MSTALAARGNSFGPAAALGRLAFWQRVPAFAGARPGFALPLCPAVFLPHFFSLPCLCRKLKSKGAYFWRVAGRVAIKGGGGRNALYACAGTALFLREGCQPGRGSTQPVFPSADAGVQQRLGHMLATGNCCPAHGLLRRREAGQFAGI